MGAWGYYPQDSDHTLDLLHILGNKINDELENTKSLVESNYSYAGLIILLLKINSLRKH